MSCPRPESRTPTSAEARDCAPRRVLTQDEIRIFERDAKVGLLATVSPEGYPHLTLITSLQAKGRQHLMFGQFSEGLSKKHVKRNPHVGFLVMSPDKEVWRGKANWTHAAGSGEDYELYNRKPMFRYNSYFGIHTVHYLDLVGLDGPSLLSVPRIVAGSLLAALSSKWLRSGDAVRVLKPWAEQHLSRAATMKFLCHVGDDGYPIIVPVVPMRCAGSHRLVIAPTAFHDEIRDLSAGQIVAVFGLNLQMESVLVRGVFGGMRGIAPFQVGTIDIDWVYNSMPPKQGQIYPEPPLRPIVVRADTGAR